MIEIPVKTATPLNRHSLDSLNRKAVRPMDRRSVRQMNHVKSFHSVPSVPSENCSTQASIPAGGLHDIAIPQLMHPLRKGQKTALGAGAARLKVCVGWNVKNALCDVDASAVLVTESGKVPGDEWFVFYNQTESPDRSVSISEDITCKDRQIINVDISKLDHVVKKIVFVLTINEAFEQDLNFSMIKDAYIRILDKGSNQEIVSYKVEEYYQNMTSMTIGELYMHNGVWKFNPVGNGVHKDLAGHCAIYGINLL